MTPRPLLVFLGPGLDAIEQLAASARRRQVETVWVGLPYPPRLRLRARLFCDQVTSAKSPEALVGVLRGLDLSRVVDLICTEDVLPAVVSAAEAVAEAGLSAEVIEDARRRLRLSEKWQTRELLATHGILVPPGLHASTTTAAEAAERLGLPLVVKGVVGAAGATVRIAETAQEAQWFADTLQLRMGVFYEQLVPGRETGYGASYDARGTVLQEGSFASVRSAHDPTGFAGRVQPEDRSDVRRVGREVVAAIGGRGLVNMDLMTDDQGRVYVLDVNPRPWHTAGPLLDAGVDFAAGYLHALGVAPSPPGRLRPVNGVEVEGYPREAAELIRRKPVAGARMLVRQSRAYRRRAGTGYVVAAMFRVGMTIGARLYRDLMQSGHPVSAYVPLLGEYRDEIGPTPTRPRRR